MGHTTSQAYCITINSGVVIKTTSLPGWTAGLTGYSQTVVAMGGTGTLTFS